MTSSFIDKLQWSKPDADGDRSAQAGNILFKIIRSTDGFGIVAYRNGEIITRGHAGPIEWRRTVKNCKARAEELLKEHRS